MTVYSQFLSGNLRLAVPVFTPISENVTRFLASNGIVPEGASRDQVMTALGGGTQSFFERIQRPDETLSQTALRFRTCLVGVGWTPLLQRLRDKLQAPFLPLNIAYPIAHLLFEGGLKTFDDAGERSDTLIAKITDFKTMPVKAANAGLRQLARKMPKAGLGEHAAGVWIALTASRNGSRKRLWGWVRPRSCGPFAPKSTGWRLLPSIARPF